MIRGWVRLWPVLLFLGCRTLDLGAPLEPADPRPKAWLSALASRGLEPQAIRARARLDLDAPDLSFDRPQRMAVERPARLRVEILGLFAQLAAVVVTDGHRYQVYDARDGDLQEGPVDSSLLWRFARIDLDPPRAVELLLGSVRLSPELTTGTSWGFKNGEVSVERFDAKGVVREDYRFDPKGRLIEASHFGPDGAALWRAVFEDYRVLDRPNGMKIDFPYEIELNFPRVSARARLRYSAVQVEDQLPDALFKLDLPKKTSSFQTERIPEDWSRSDLGAKR
ncbi:MAG: hypothetical protein CBC48_09220 [bacterium TMED88]|nr:hypothetical protein [Deltaproteobacteria bacterium]OUV31747.1 MAG: hypothetical protein CBC48_09220 [bacterium TMED88]